MVLLVLSDAAAIRSTLLEDPQAAAALSGKHVLQMGTIGPAESISIAADVEAAGAQYMEAPVLGSQPEAEQGTLLVMVGSKEAPDGTPPGLVLKAFCSEANYIGEVCCPPHPFATFRGKCLWSWTCEAPAAITGCIAEHKNKCIKDLNVCKVQIGTAAAVKLALNQLIASLTVGFSTSLALLQARFYML